MSNTECCSVRSMTVWFICREENEDVVQENGIATYYGTLD